MESEGSDSRVVVLLVEKGGDQSGEVLEDSGSRVIVLPVNVFAKGGGWIHLLCFCLKPYSSSLQSLFCQQLYQMMRKHK